MYPGFMNEISFFNKKFGIEQKKKSHWSRPQWGVHTCETLEEIKNSATCILCAACTSHCSVPPTAAPLSMPLLLFPSSLALPLAELLGYWPPLFYPVSPLFWPIFGCGYFLFLLAILVSTFVLKFFTLKSFYTALSLSYFWTVSIFLNRFWITFLQ